MSIETISVQYIKGVGGKIAERLYNNLRIKSVKDLLYYFPRDWEDRANPTKIAEIKPGEKITIKGKVEHTPPPTTEWRGKYLVAFKAKIKDPTGTATAIWIRRYSRNYDVLSTLKKEITKGCEIFITGVASYDFWEKIINVQEYEVVTSADLLHSNRIVPIYPLTEKFTNKFLRTIINQSLVKHCNLIEEPLPEKYLNKYNLVSIKQALKNIHFPDTFADRDNARERLAFDEFFEFQLKLELLKQQHKKETKEFRYTLTKKLLSPFKKGLPFEFTSAQKKVINELFDDMLSSKPMNRLLQGEVGSGKTVVALSAMLLAVESGFQTVLLAPTEILAEQHFSTLKNLLKNLPITIECVIGKMPKKKKTVIKNKIADGTANIIIGTHALLEEDIKFKNLSLVIIDEQHRFGVEQRLKLRKKSVFRNTDFLLMTATPIPRTLGLTFYGDLDILTINELPPGRIPVKTITMSKEFAYNFVKEKIVSGDQVFIVYPLVDESEKLQLKSVIKEAEKLKNTEFKNFSVGLIHGRLKPEEKEQIMLDFAKKNYDILISTTVIEVGIDIPNATVMVIEHSERYGLSTLHQLRGRVGRSNKESFCILLGEPRTDEAKKRLDILTKTTDGFKIAETDLQLRGPGDFFGTAQSGIPEFKLGNILTDFAIIKQAKQLAVEIIQNEPALVSRITKNQNLQKLDLATA
ncbi:MAG: ATP-dependent DNA helicase RecG [Elusimicrobiota bacterium]